MSPIALGVFGSARVGSSPPAGFAYIGAVAATVSAATQTFVDVPLGAESTGRTIVLALTNHATLTSVTIAGVSATKDAEHVGTASTRATIWRAAVPTGTSGTVVVVMGSATLRCAFAVYRIDGAVTVPATDTLDPVVMSVATGDYVVAGGYTTSGGMTVSGATLDRLAVMDSGNYYFAASAAAATTGTLTVDASSTFAMAGVAYRLV